MHGDGGPEPEVTTVEPVDVAVVRGTVPMSDLPPFFDRAFPALGAFLAERKLTPAGPPFAHYTSPPGATVDLEVGFPLDVAPEPGGDVVPSRLPGGRVATVVHQGGYDGLPAAWNGLMEWVARQGLTPSGGFWEVYLTEPTPDGDPAANRTALNVLVQG